jgi:hypothetical protein
LSKQTRHAASETGTNQPKINQSKREIMCHVKIVYAINISHHNPCAMQAKRVNLQRSKTVDL